MKITFVQAPYDRGRADTGVARGPKRFRERGVDRGLVDAGHDVVWTSVDLQTTFEDELTAVAEVNHQVKTYVQKAQSDNRLPILVCGNCINAHGVIAALGAARTGVIWFDAHGDFNTPESSPSGFLDGMALASATGRCHRDYWRRLAAGEVVPDSHILLAGIRDLDTSEEELLNGADVAVVRAEALNANGGRALIDALDALRSTVEDVYVHFDVDALDPEVTPGVEYKSAGGLSLDQVERAVEWIGERFRIRAAALSAFSPDYDDADKTVAACARLVDKTVQAAGKPS